MIVFKRKGQEGGGEVEGIWRELFIVSEKWGFLIILGTKTRKGQRCVLLYRDGNRNTGIPSLPFSIVFSNLSRSNDQNRTKKVLIDDWNHSQGRI